MRVILVFPCLHYVPLWFPEAPDQVIIFIVHYRNFPQLRMECKKIHQFFNREPYQIVYDLRLFWNWHLKTITLMFSKPTECKTPRVNVDANYGLWVIMTQQCRFIDGGILRMGELCMWRLVVCGKVLLPSPQFYHKPNTTLKSLN